eukprot:SAG31_NODE_18945_length_617_cov_0.691120_2_plen_158_part_01
MSKAKMLQLLEQTNFPDFNRKDVLRKGQKHYKGMVLGKVRKMYSSCDGKMCKVESRHNKRYPGIQVWLPDVVRPNKTFDTQVSGSPRSRCRNSSCVSIVPRSNTTRSHKLYRVVGFTTANAGNIQGVATSIMTINFDNTRHLPHAFRVGDSVKILVTS